MVFKWCFTFATVEDDAVKGHAFSKILDCLCLASPGWPSSVSAKLVAKCRGQRHVRTVSQASDNKATAQARVLVSVLERANALLDNDIVGTAVPVETQLTLPGKLAWTQHAAIIQIE